MRRGLALLAGTYLSCWIPFTFATELLGVLPSLAMRGRVALAELGLHALISALCAAAGWMLWTRAPAAFGAAAAAIPAAALIQIQSLFWTALPRNHAPGDRVPLAAVSVFVAALWLVLVYVARPRHVS
jgi:hypothetical protein